MESLIEDCLKVCNDSDDNNNFYNMLPLNQNEASASSRMEGFETNRRVHFSSLNTNMGIHQEAVLGHLSAIDDLQENRENRGPPCLKSHNCYFSILSHYLQAHPPCSFNDELESFDSFILSMVESHHLTFTETSLPFLLPLNKQYEEEMSSLDSPCRDNVDDNDENDDDEQLSTLLASSDVTTTSTTSTTTSHSPRCHSMYSNTSDCSLCSTRRKNSSTHNNNNGKNEPMSNTNDAGGGGQASELVPSDPAPSSCHSLASPPSVSTAETAMQSERVRSVLLCFVALPVTRRSPVGCFTPSPDMSFMNVNVKPLIEFERVRFLFLRFRFKYWVGVASTLPTKTARRLNILNIVRRRKSRLPPRSLDTSTSSPAFFSATTPAPQDDLRHLRRPLRRYRSLDCGFVATNGIAQYRDCHAIMTVPSGEILGIAPCHPIHANRLVPSSPCSLQQFSDPGMSVPIDGGHSSQQFNIREAIDDWLLSIDGENKQ